MPDARDVLTDSEMAALHDVLMHVPKVDWAEYDSAMTKIRAHTLAPEAQRRVQHDTREAPAYSR